jgi:hypothetical protein
MIRRITVTSVPLLAALTAALPAIADTIPGTTLTPSVWLDASDITGLASGDLLPTWVDSSGNGRNATQTNTTRQPTYQASAANGLPAVRFNINAGDPNEFMAFPGALANTPESALTLFVIASDTGQRTPNTGGSPQTRGIVVNTRTNTAQSNGFLLGFGDVPASSVNYAHVNHTMSDGTGSIQNQVIAPDSSNITMMVVNRQGVVSSLSAYTDSTNATSSAEWTGTNINGQTGFTPSNLTTTQIGTEGGARYLFGDIYEIIAFDEVALSAADQLSVSTYLADKYGIAGVAGTPSPAGDFDGNGLVNGADLEQWKGDFGINPISDADGDGDSDGDDFLIWQRGLGASGTAANVAAIPEPSGLILTVTAGILLGWRRLR